MFFKTLKIFLGLKWQEVTRPIIDHWGQLLASFLTIAFITGILVGNVFIPGLKWLIIIPSWIIGVLFLFMGVWAFCHWLRSNWREAKRRSAPPSASEEE